MKKKQLRLLRMVSKYTLYGTILQLAFFSFVFASNSEAQNISSVKKVDIEVEFQNTGLLDIFSDIEAKTDYKFVYFSSDLKSAKAYFNMRKQTVSVAQLLMELSQKYQVAFKQVNNSIIVNKIKKNDPKEKPLEIVMEGVTVRGKVTSEDSPEGLPGVNVLVKGTNLGTITDFNGDYVLEVPSKESVLVFSYVGYISEEAVVGERRVIDMVITADITALEEIVVVGYGTQKKGDVTSSVASIKSDEFVKGNVQDVGQLIQGKVAGLTVSAPTGDPTGNTQILLRGNSTILGTNQDPLILIDGIPGDFNTVAPEDIESIDVLKDGSAAAIYGTRGTNGVILITTKRANSSYTNRVDYSASFSTQNIAKKLDVLTAADYRRQIEEGSRAETQDKGASTNWLDETTQTPFTQVHNLTFRGGNAETNYLVNLNYRDLEGIFLESDNNTFTGRVDVNHNMFGEKLTLNMGLLNRSNWYNTSGDGYGFDGYTYRQTLIYNPTAPVKNEDGSWYENTGNFNYENPVSRIKESDGENRSQNTRMNSTITYKPIDGLRFSAKFSVNKYNETRGYAESKQHISNLRDGKNGYVSNGTRETRDRLVELTGEFSKSIDKHTFKILGGYGYQDYYYRDYYMSNWDFPIDIFSYNNIDLGKAIEEGQATMEGYTEETNLISFFGRGFYNYEDKYLLMGSVRYEAASQFKDTNDPWGIFPSVSVGWRISNESFMSGVGFLDNLKIRVGYGITGTSNDAIYGAVDLVRFGDYFYYNGEWIRTLNASQNANPDLKWEEKHETNIGVDFGLFDNRISGTIDYYYREIQDLLYDYSVPSPPNLYTVTRANVGVMENKGLEVLVNFIPVTNPDFEWSTSFNFSTNTNKLVSLSNDLYETTNDYFTEGSTGEPIQTYTHLVEIGKAIGNFHGFKVVDIDDNGKWIYEDADGERVSYDDFSHAFEDKKILGNGLPKYYAGWNNNLRYKNWDLSIVMRGAFDYQILNFERMYLENPTIEEYNRLKSSEELVFGKAELTADLEYNSYYIEDGDFWKIDNITIGYNFPNLENKFIKSARIYFSTLNALTITGYKGIDPEVDRLGLDPGNDYRDKYPTTRTFTLGINASF